MDSTVTVRCAGRNWVVRIVPEIVEPNGTRWGADFIAETGEMRAAVARVSPARIVALAFGWGYRMANQDRNREPVGS